MTAPPPDFPAAHSMDTTWFAVDADGHVGAFESGEDGAVPRSALGEDLHVDMLESMPAQLTWEEWFRGLRWHPVSVLEGAPQFRVFGFADRALAEPLRGRSDVEVSVRLHDDLAECLVLPPNQGQRVLIQVEGPSPRALELLRTAGVEDILVERPDGHDLAPLWTGWMDFEEHAFVRGVYAFSPRSTGVPGPYCLGLVPVRPLHASMFPRELWSSLRAVEFRDLRFADRPRIQPLEMGIPCGTWNASFYLATDGSVRPLKDEDVPPESAEWAREYHAEMAAAVAFYERLHAPLAGGEAPDFPAAHSMDTTWFAVDADGHVAQFDSGESGAVPEGAESQSFDEGWLASTPPQVTKAEWLRRLRWHPVSVLQGAPPMTVFGMADRTRAAVLALRFYRQPVTIHEGKLADAPDQVVVEIAAPSDLAMEILRVAGIREIAIQRPWGNDLDPMTMNEEDFARLPFVRGLYVYFAEDVSGPGPYHRESEPLRPLHASMFPREAWGALRAVEFKGIRFAEARAIQPLELGMKCMTWQADAYRATDGTFRTMDGRPAPPELVEDWAGEDNGEFEAAVAFYERLHPPEPRA